MMTFYKPFHGDTASIVADGYAGNFESLDTAKANASEMNEALDEKVDKVDGQRLSSNDYTAADFAKLAGIETGANAYTHPETHPADMVTDTAAKVVMTAAERAKLSGVAGEANAYSLPVATAEILGGVKVGQNLTIDADGRLNAQAGGGSTLNLWTGTQAQYDALAEKTDDTLYFIRSSPQRHA